MPKERRSHDPSSRRSKASPFSCSSSRARQPLSRNPLDTEAVKEWEEARCPVCMEHPHNAVLLICSSHDKGCHPYMCDTSHRHSNCLDQFRKAFAESPSAPAVQASPTLGDLNNNTSQERQSILHLESEEPSLHSVPCEGQEQPKLSCPLCRGRVNGWVVVEPARQFMNAKVRCCAREMCVFSGTYGELRKHARLEHPLVRPSEVDPEREREWRRMEQQRDLGDVLSTFQSASGEEWEDDSQLRLSEGRWLTVYFLIRVLPRAGLSPGLSPELSPSWSVPSRFRGLRRSRRRTALGRSNAGEPAPEREADESESELEGVSAMWHRRERSHQSSTPDDEQS